MSYTLQQLKQKRHKDKNGRRIPWAADDSHDDIIQRVKELRKKRKSKK